MQTFAGALGGVYHNDALARERQLSPEAAFPSGAQRASDENAARVDESTIGRAQDGAELRVGQSNLLFAESLDEANTFLSQPGAPIDNNIVERALKKAILNRRNAQSYRTLNGARTGDLFMSLIYTCELNGANPFDYLTELRRHSARLLLHSSEWMPWNYREALTGLAMPATA